ncbi:hypothetical protein BOO71_0004024 [Deinococcus marmoris]|uniref:Uncharacterized protein n=1 Tax=Deinococcus marmoris TaxID=249408 RepID=A0A1U7P1G3_9DEIO|nr:hypothetical protein BOO71_0004024 [Deinococcus marmoris]
MTGGNVGQRRHLRCAGGCLRLGSGHAECQSGGEDEQAFLHIEPPKVVARRKRLNTASEGDAGASYRVSSPGVIHRFVLSRLRNCVLQPERLPRNGCTGVRSEWMIQA